MLMPKVPAASRAVSLTLSGTRPCRRTVAPPCGRLDRLLIAAMPTTLAQFAYCVADKVVVSCACRGANARCDTWLMPHAAVWICATRQLPAMLFKVMNTMLWVGEAFHPSRPVAVVVTASWR